VGLINIHYDQFIQLTHARERHTFQFIKPLYQPHLLYRGSNSLLVALKTTSLIRRLVDFYTFAFANENYYKK
jgi:hypothetical protein